jgi:mono/diheme cytochrome c family protein
MKRFLILLPLASLFFGCTPGPQTPKEASPQVLASGLQVYTTNCATCHQVDGSGVPNIQPALIDDDIVAGDPTQLIRVVLQGPTAVLSPDRPRYSNKMPSFNRLTDQQIADVLTYIRHDYGHEASVINLQQVQTVRAQFGL